MPLTKITRAVAGCQPREGQSTKDSYRGEAVRRALALDVR